MSLRSDEAEAPGRSGKRWSISTRLIVLHLLLVSFGFLASAGILFAIMVHHMEEANDKGLKGEANAIKAMLRLPDGGTLLAQEIATQKYEADDNRALIRVMDAHGRILQESSGMTRILPATVFPVRGDEQAKGGQATVHGNTYLLRTFSLPRSASTAEGNVLQLAVNITDDEAFLYNLKIVYGAFVLSGLVFSLLSTILIVRSGLKPLTTISDVVRQITQRHLHTRIELAPLPVEIVSLAVSFNTMLGRLEDSFSQLSHYSANLAHELRTPINNLMVEADIALSRPREPEEYEKVISSSMDEYARLALIIDKLLFLARADSEQNELMVAPLDVESEVEDIFDFYADMANESGVELVCRGTALLLADQPLFRRAVSNVVANALAYTPRGGSIVVSTWQEADFSITVVVSDTGCGIEPHHLTKIFDRFYRVDTTRGMVPTGTGLGLAIVKAIMSMHCGSVEVQSEIGQGTTLTLKFPQPDTDSIDQLSMQFTDRLPAG